MKVSSAAILLGPLRVKTHFFATHYSLGEFLNKGLAFIEGHSFLYFFNYQKADNKIFVCKFSKNVKSKLYHIENSKTRGQTV